MKCAWDAFIQLLPIRFRDSIDRHGRTSLQELRLRVDQSPELVTSAGSLWLNGKVSREDLQFCINAASRYSPWTAESSARGYITAEGGHRIGLCGDAVLSDGMMTGIRSPRMLCIRVARDFPGISDSFQKMGQSVLIIGCPGSGKTTLLRDLIRNYSNNGSGSIAVVDEREEIFPSFRGVSCFSTGKRTDILTGCKKSVGIETVLRCMGPQTIAVDEITAQEDCDALMRAGWCGVHLLATAHAENLEALYKRKVYAPIVESHLFDVLLALKQDKSWSVERMMV